MNYLTEINSFIPSLPEDKVFMVYTITKALFDEEEAKKAVPKEWLLAKDAAKKCKCSTVCLRQNAKDGRIAFKPGPTPRKTLFFV